MTPNWKGVSIGVRPLLIELHSLGFMPALPGGAASEGEMCVPLVLRKAHDDLLRMWSEGETE